MKNFLVIGIIFFAGLLFSKDLFSATFELTGTWNYKLSDNWASGGINCNPGPDASGTCVIDQEGDMFTFAFTSGVVCSPPESCTFEGTISGTVYICTTTDIVDEENGSATSNLSFTATSQTSASGSGTSRYTHPSGLWECNWENTIILSRSGSDNGGVDNDGDGYTIVGGDCDDNDAQIHPNAIEICGDGIDQNCDGKECPIVSDIKANGSDGPIDIRSGDNLSVTIALSPNEFAGDNADWWLVAATPTGLLHYQLETGLFVPSLTYSHQGPLFNLGGFEVLNISLPVGSATIYFGIDMNMNGLLDIGQAYYDSVTINVQ